MCLLHSVPHHRGLPRRLAAACRNTFITHSPSSTLAPHLSQIYATDIKFSADA